MVIIEPDSGGCTVYNDLYRSYIRGNLEEVCRQILRRTCAGVTERGTPRQIITIGIVTGGRYTACKDRLLDMGVSYIVDIPCKHIDVVLPVIDEQT